MKLERVHRVILSALGELPLSEGGSTFKPAGVKRETKTGEVPENTGCTEKQTFAEVKLCRPKTKDFVAVGNQPFTTAGSVVSLLSSISGVPEVVINQFDIDDISMLRVKATRIVEQDKRIEP
jgi:hypothetical protein